jgi:hypothetical protein
MSDEAENTSLSYLPVFYEKLFYQMSTLSVKLLVQSKPKEHAPSV